MSSTDGLENARQINIKVNIAMKQRGLSLNRDKSICLIIGSEKQKTKASRDLIRQPLMCGDFETNEKQQDKWLGQILSSAGLTDCVAQTVSAREGKIRGACLEIAVIINDWRAKVLGGLETALMLWETCCVPSLLHGASTWVEMSSETEKTLNNLQCWFVRLVLQIGPGAPLSALLWDNQLLDMGLRVWVEKTMLVLHIRSLDKESLASRIYYKQMEENWTGLVDETKQICIELGIEDCNTTSMSRTNYRAVVTTACHRLNEERLRCQASVVKCGRIANEEYGKKSYVSNQNIEASRKWFRTRFGLQDFAGNYSHNRKFAKSDWLCRCKTDREEEGHIIRGQCSVYEDLRPQFGDLSEDSNLVEYFQAVLDRREDLENEDRKRQSSTAAVAASSVPVSRTGTSRPRD